MTSSGSEEQQPAATPAGDPRKHADSLKVRALVFLALAVVFEVLWWVFGPIVGFSWTALTSGAVAIAAAVTGAFVTIHRDDLRKHIFTLRQVQVVIGVSLVAAAVGVLVAVIQPTSIPSDPPQSPVAQPPVVPGTTPPPPPPNPTDPLVHDNGCNIPNPSDKKIPDYLLCVMNWCQGNVYYPDGSLDESRIQIKVHPRVANNTSDTLDLSIWKPAALRMLVSSSDLPLSWRPPPATTKESDTPYTVEYEDQTYWAVAPNVPHDIDQMVGPVTGFATFWDLDSVGPNSLAPPLTYNDPDGHVKQQGDLVFQLPEKTNTNNAKIYGLALISRQERTHVLAVAKFDDWGPRLDPNFF